MEILATRHIPGTSGSVDLKTNIQPKADIGLSEIVTDFRSLLDCWEAIDGRARLMLSRQGQIIAQSEGAGRFFDQEQCPGLAKSLHLASAATVDKRLRRIFSVNVGEVATATLPKRSGDGHYLISATGVSASTIAVAIREADSAFVTVLADLEEAFGLTRCEVLVIENLMHGLVARQIAAELAISVHTVRAHLRHCYDKLQVSSREELWQRLAPYRLN